MPFKHKATERHKFKNFYSAKETISGIENIRIIQKGQINGQKSNQSSFMNFAEFMA